MLFIDPKKENFANYVGATLVKPNLEAAALASGVDIVDERSLARAGQTLLERWRCEAVLMSRGEEGMTLFRHGRAMQHFPTAAREVFDVTGAGDTVLASAALALAAGASFEEAAVLANRAAGIVVGKLGTATASAAELLAELALMDRVVKSMTGFGAATVPLGARSRGSLSVEVKSVNQRFLDLKLSLPKEYVVWEGEVRKFVQDRVGRGRVEIYVNRSVTTSERPRVEIDEELARAYVLQWRKLKRTLRVGGEIDLSLLKGIPDLYRPRENSTVTGRERSVLAARALDRPRRARPRPRRARARISQTTFVDASTPSKSLAGRHGGAGDGESRGHPASHRGAHAGVARGQGRREPRRPGSGIPSGARRRDRRDRASAQPSRRAARSARSPETESASGSISCCRRCSGR